MVAPIAVTFAIGAASLLISSLFGGVHDFAPGACDRIEPHLLSEIVGQELAVHQVADAVCDHLADESPQKPLVFSAHGPPGVGKSMLHLLLARSLYSKTPAAALKCPGSGCLGYKVLYGMDYIQSDRKRQHEMLKAAVLEHLRFHPETLLVIEEYDKLDCPTRGLLKQLVDSSHSTNVTINKSIIMLESNTGFPQLHEMLEAVGSREKVAPEAAQRLLKDLMFGIWGEGSCESSTDTVKLLSLIDFFLPFLPLEAQHIRRLFEMRLQERAAELLTSTGDTLSWPPVVVDFLLSKIDFEGRYPIEGAKEVKTLMTRYVTRALRAAAAAEAAAVARSKAAHKASGSKNKLPRRKPRSLRLRVTTDGRGLEVAA